jgi:hypothetical protein
MTYLLVLFVGIGSARHATGQAALPKGASTRLSYPEIKLRYEQAVANGLTKAMHREELRRAVRSGPLGPTGLARALKNLDGRHAIDPTIPGVGKNLLLTASSNPNVRQGALRTHLYATRVSHDRRFELVGVNRPVYGPNGRVWTDRDVVLRHRGSGQKIGIEVKSVQARTQSSNWSRYKAQIEKMVWEARRTRQLQAWVNRHEAIPKLKVYAEHRGVRVYENVRTSSRGWRAGQRRFSAVLRDLDRQATVRTPSTRGSPSLTSGVSQRVAGSSRLALISRQAGPAAWVILAGTEVLSVRHWYAGNLTQRQFYAGQAQFFGGLAGGWAGAKAGAILGATIGAVVAGPIGGAVGATIGGILGGIGGGYSASALASAATTAYFDLQDQEQDRQFQEFVCSLYGIK